MRTKTIKIGIKDHKETLNQFVRETEIYSLYDLKRHYYHKTKGHWFDKDTMQFFQCRLSETLYYSPIERRIYFVSSEKQKSFTFDYNRQYTARVYNVDTGEISELGEFGQYSTGQQAHAAIRKQIKMILNNN